MKFGFFDDANKEYVIQNPRTPVSVDQLPGYPGILLSDFQHSRRLPLL